MNTDLRIVTRRVHSAVAPLSDRDRRVVERRARRASEPGGAPPHLGRRLASRVVAIVAALPGLAARRAPRPEPRDGVAGPARSTLRAA